jgi:ATP-binding cassette, subfamily B, multidrug efflux pump
MSENRQQSGSRAGGGMRRGPMGGGGPMGGFGRPVEKPKNFKGTLKRLLKYLKPHTITLIVVFIFTIGSTVFTVYAPMRSRLAMNSLQQSLVAKGVITGITKAESNPQLQMGLKAQGVPLIADATTNDQKADAVNAFIGLVLKMPPEQLKAMMTASGSASTGTSFMGYDLTKLSQKDLDTFIGYIRSTGGHIDFDLIGKIMLQMLALYLLSSGFSFVMSYMMSGVSQKTVYVMRTNVNDKLARLPLKFFDSRTHGEILSRMTNDMDTIAQTLQQNLTQVISSIVQIIGYTVMMLTISPILTLIVMATLPLYIVATMFIAKASQKFYAAQQKHLGELSGHVEEMYGGHKVVKAFGHEEKAVEKFKGINDELYNAGWKAQFMSGIMFPIMNFISNLGYVLICVVGGIYAAKKALELGDITTFIQYSRSFTQPIIQTSNIANVIQSTIACAERVFELLDETEQLPDKADPVEVGDLEGEVKFNNVKFGYNDEKILMEDMNISVKPGQTIAIVGPTGGGKTTLVNLLMRFYEVNSGSITVDGMDTRDMRRADLRHIFGMVLQDTWLFTGTIRDNIAYGKEGATEEEIIAAAKSAHADRFIRTLPEGYDTILNEEASNISSGQKQLLTIARAILADPPIMILDEATSSVDTRTEIRIQRAMHNLMKGRTSFVIAHRLSTIRDADLILVMNHGSIIETGTHQELLAAKGFYSDLYMSQFTGAYNTEEQAG